ncbi:colicin V production protein [Weissella oryzae SG25]|uniref:Colicin V production protein n=1 Tax=Weissella oryzae (strain DSM 25784 / JCM 18191 / LMG 30913 / SG25) TaxID=1329250 RepID=A0A069CU19_WEIOS|nr:CvpA family protein [Weissella oryzae]GAK31265.1 colicin V production protein [Weissella oryzae SG25]
MVLTFILAIILLLAWRKGYHNGLLRTFIRLIGRVLIWVVALLFAHRLGAWLLTSFFTGTTAQYGVTSMPDVAKDTALQFMTSGIAFGVITMIGYFILRSVENGVNFLNHIPVIGWVNRLLGGLLNIGIIYVLLFFVLQIFQTWQVPWWQNQLTSSDFAQWILTQTPFLSNEIYQWWIAQA